MDVKMFFINFSSLFLFPTVYHYFKYFLPVQQRLFFPFVRGIKSHSLKWGKSWTTIERCGRCLFALLQI